MKNTKSNLSKSKIITITLAIIILLLVAFQENITNLFSGYFDKSKVEVVVSMMTFNLLAVTAMLFFYIFVVKRIDIKIVDKETRNFLFVLLILLFLFIGYITFSDLILQFQIVERSEDVKWHTYLILPLKLEKNILTVLGNRFFISELDYRNIEIPVYNLYIKQDHIDKLNSNLPFSGTEFVPAYFQVDKNVFRGKVRYRGDNYFHWGSTKKSWRVNLKNDQLFQRVDKFNLINPKSVSYMIMPFMAELLKETGNIYPRSYNVALYINNEYVGVYEYLDQTDESFLRLNNLLPGDIYLGDKPRDEKEWITREQQKWLAFDDYKRWDLQATFDNNTKRAFDNIKYFLDNVNTKNESKFYNFYKDHFGEEYLRFLAQKTIVNDTHTDDRHNHKIYFDPSSGKYIPIGWDQLIFKIREDSTLDLIASIIDRQILKFPHLIHKKNKFLFEHINSFDESKAIKFIEENEKKLEQPMFYDIYKDVMDWPLSKNITMEEWKKGIKELKDVVSGNYKLIREKLSDVQIKVTLINSGQLVFNVSGISGVRADNKKSCLLVKKHLLSHDYFCLGNKEIDSTFYPGRNIKTEVIKAGRYFIDVNRTETSELSYVFDVNNIEAFSKIKDIKFYNAVTGEEIIPDFEIKEKPSKDYSNYLAPIYSVHPWKYEEDDKEVEIIWDDNVTVNEDIVLPKNHNLIINPGSVVEIKENKSIISFGRIIAKGTKEKPITIKSTTDKPWGVIAVQGKDAHLEFDWVNISNGSGASHNLANYTGMISIYNSSAEINNSTFKDNKQYDDTLNAKKSKIKIQNSVFENAFGDAIDLDISEGVISSTNIYKSKGDAIDLMTSPMLIQDVNIYYAGDKGISIGEDSMPEIRNVNIFESNTGIAIKDKSDPKIFGIKIDSGNLGIAAYKKNWRYGSGGFGTIYDAEICNNETVLEIDENSKMMFVVNNEKIMCDNSLCDIGCNK